MGLESATYISGLDPANPLGTDSQAQGDDHLRLIKQVLKNTFPNLNAAVTVTPTELNYLSGVTANVQTQLDAKEATANKGQAGGYCELDASALVPLARIPATLTGKDADTVDGAHAGTAAGDVLKLDASGLVPLGNIPATLTGKDADTVDGAHAGTAANNVLKLDASGLVPLGNIPATLTGKDADTVDGVHASGLAQKGLDELITGVWTHRGQLKVDDVGAAVSPQLSVQSDDDVPWQFGLLNATFSTTQHTFLSQVTSVGNLLCRLYNADGSSYAALRWQQSDGELYLNNNKVWHAGNYGNKTISTASPSGGVDGDVWFQV